MDDVTRYSQSIATHADQRPRAVSESGCARSPSLSATQTRTTSSTLLLELREDQEFLWT